MSNDSTSRHYWNMAHTMALEIISESETGLRILTFLPVLAVSEFPSGINKNDVNEDQH